MSIIYINPYAFSAPWTPANITTALWLDASDSSTITTVSDAVSQWDDKSGNNRHATQATSDRRPAYTSSGLNAKNIITFDGDNDYLITTSASYAAVNYFMVSKCISRSQYDALFAARSSLQTKGVLSDITVTLSTATDTALFSNHAFNASYAMIDASNVASLSNFNNFDAGSNSTGTNWFLFDMAITATSAGTKSFALGADIFGDPQTRTFNCAIAEFVITSSELSTADRERMQGYFAHKWGLTENLPGGHPYKTAAPTA